MKRGTLRNLFSRKPRVNKVEAQKPTPKAFEKKEKKSKHISSRARRDYALKSNGKRVGFSRFGGGLGPAAQNDQAIYSPPRRKLKGWQKDHKGRKVY